MKDTYLLPNAYFQPLHSIVTRDLNGLAQAAGKRHPKPKAKSEAFGRQEWRDATGSVCHVYVRKHLQKGNYL